MPPTKFALRVSEEIVETATALTGTKDPVDLTDLYLLIEPLGPMEFKVSFVSEDFLRDEDGHGKEDIHFIS